MSPAGHRKLSASLWSIYTAAVSIYGFSTLPSPETPDVTPIQLFALSLFGLAAITGFCFVLHQQWAHATMRVFTMVFVICVGLELAMSPREFFFYHSFAALLGQIIVTAAFLIAFYACIVSWRTPLRSRKV